MEIPEKLITLITIFIFSFSIILFITSIIKNGVANSFTFQSATSRWAVGLMAIYIIVIVIFILGAK